MAHILHDFWLTRNGHGSGFWDNGNYPTDIGNLLTESCCKNFKKIELYVGDDGKIYGV